MSEWQPIETAPKGDVEFLGWDGKILDKTWQGWTERDMPVYVREDWRSWKPTHWMSCRFCRASSSGFNGGGGIKASAGFAFSTRFIRHCASESDSACTVKRVLGGFSLSILKKLEEAQVFAVDLLNDDTRAEFTEQCDRYFSVNLTASEMYELIDELTAIAERMNLIVAQDGVKP